jgi:hypothetical protein
MAKTVNYTPEMEKEIRSAFEGEVDHKAAVVELAEAFGKSVASVRQKAVRMGLYKKAEYVSKNGAKVETKGAIVADIAEALGVNVEAAESLEKATKSVLLKVREALSSEG